MTKGGLMVTEQRQRSLIQTSISYALLAMIALYAITSVGNVVEFVSHYHDGWTGSSLGGGFGLTIFVSAYIASIARTRSTRFYALIVAGCFGLSSAWFQMTIYLEGGASPYIAAVLAFVPIVVGEIGIALLESSYSQEHEIVHQENETARWQTKLNQLQQQLATASTEAEKATALQEQITTLQQALQQSQNEAAEYREKASNSDSLAADVNKLAAERDSLAAKYEHIANEYQQSAINIDLLPQRLRGELQAGLELVTNGRITSQQEFITAAEWGRSKAQDIFKTIEALRLIRFENDEWRVVTRELVHVS